MKKVSAILAVALMATAANAATIGLRWADTAAQNHDGAGTVQVVINLLPGDTVSGANADFVGVSGTWQDLQFGNYQTSLPGWQFTGASGGIGAPNFAGMFSGSNDAGSDLTAAGEHVIGTFSVGFPVADGSQAGFAALFPQNSGGGVLQSGAASYAWDDRYNDSTAGYIAFGDFGNPGWGTKTTKGHQPTANPLLITKVPEPTGLALIALGGFALLRRR